MNKIIKELKNYILLWSSQSLSQLGSNMTSFALSIWVYEKTNSALQSAALIICNYVPYVIVPIFAGALSDKWNKKTTMLVCDSFAALTTFIVLYLIIVGKLFIWHIYLINIVNGLMNTFQQPASETAISIVTPKQYLHITSGMNSFSRSLITILSPILATTLYSLFNIKVVCLFDLFTFLVAFIVLLLFIRIPKIAYEKRKEKIIDLIKQGNDYLKENRLILNIILFLSGINFVASAFESVLSPLVLSKTNYNESILGIVSSFSGIAMLLGSLFVTFTKQPKDNARTIYYSLFISMLIENFLFAFSDNYYVWCFAQILGWFPIPIFNASYDVLFKTSIPLDMQGRVYSFRNCLQFFTIPLGHFVGGLMVDKVFEPIMANTNSNLLKTLFGVGLGSGAAFSMFVLGVMGILVCLYFKNRIINID